MYISYRYFKLYVYLLYLFYICNFVCRKQVTGGRAEADKDGVVIPTTLEEYCIKTKVRAPEVPLDMTDFYVDDYDLDDDDDNLDVSGDEYDDGDDSGNGES